MKRSAPLLLILSILLSSPFVHAKLSTWKTVKEAEFSIEMPGSFEKRDVKGKDSAARIFHSLKFK